MKTCKNCGRATKSQYGYCQRSPECRVLHNAVYNTGTTERRACKGCGRKLKFNSKYDYCTSSPECYRQHKIVSGRDERMKKGAWSGGLCAGCGVHKIHKGNKSGYCSETEACRKEQQNFRTRKFRDNNPHYDIVSLQNRGYRGRERKLLGDIKLRAARQGIPFALEVDDLPPVPERCPIFGVPFYVPDGTTNGGPKRFSLTLDRIDPRKGYEAGNVWWISALANRMKTDAIPDELIQFADWVHIAVKRGDPTFESHAAPADDCTFSLHAGQRC